MMEVWHANGDGSVSVTGREPYPLRLKLCPTWWLHGPDGWNVPEVNNGEPYLPDVKSIWLRRFYWFFCRNPLMNFVGFVVGAEDRNYTVTGSPGVLATTGRDTVPPTLGWRWAVIRCGWLRLPYVNYYNDKIEFYLGWRPASGGLGLKFVIRAYQ